MDKSSQNRALKNYRRRLGERGLARFEVLALGSDRELVRSLAKRLAENDAEASRLRSEVSRAVVRSEPRRGGILAALRRSPLVGADIDVSPVETAGRAVDL